MADESTNPAPAGAAGSTTTTTEPAPTTAAPVIDVTKIPDEALKDRLDRAKRQALKDAGFASVDDAKATRDKLAALEKAEEERKLAAMSEQEKLSKQLETEKLERERLARELESEREANKLLQVATARGIKNLDYAGFLLEKAKRDAGGQAVDIDRVMGDAIGDPMTRTALGITEETKGQPVPAAPVLATTTPGGQPPKPPTTSSTGPKTADQMTPQEWQSYKKTLGIH